MGRLRAGAAQVVITPPVGVWMAGFAARPSASQGIHDDLMAKALVLDDGAQRVALVTADLLGLDFDLLTRLKEHIQRQTGIAPEGVLFNASHTHGGPMTNTLRGMGERDEAYCDLLLRHIVGAVKMAVDRLQDARIGFGSAPCCIGFNRRERIRRDVVLGLVKRGPTDTRVDVMRVDALDGQPLAVVFRHATHPVVLGADNVLITADWCGYAARTLPHFLITQPPNHPATQPVCLFVQGCCGDINPIQRGSFEAAAWLGRIVAAASAQAWYPIETREEVTLKTSLRILPLPLQDPPSVEEAEKQLEAYQQRAADAPKTQTNPGMVRTYQDLVGWAEKILEFAKEGIKPRTQDFVVQTLTIDDTAIVGLSGEPFIELAWDIERRSPCARTWVLGYTNGCIGYVPTARAYEEGGYEVVDAVRYYGDLMIRPESAQRIGDAAVEMMRET
ncbi:MAG: neutral/alkaline non-lysosomal ceramidase N-terminal domain-containing protein [Abditibacteriales bacterium]|nr:neutral/alkaline non-lysosomal ceramidase N-terminal domain-containing protein [Abditibacteriales bacterium]MDW8367733.1 neutral/alkaline non-lysosomal ceramidase N-terminal domain-containing protein [Abditibacteriales bacterium]